MLRMRMIPPVLHLSGAAAVFFGNACSMLPLMVPAKSFGVTILTAVAIPLPGLGQRDVPRLSTTAEVMGKG